MLSCRYCKISAKHNIVTFSCSCLFFLCSHHISNKFLTSEKKVHTFTFTAAAICGGVGYFRDGFGTSLFLICAFYNNEMSLIRIYNTNPPG